MKNKTTLAYHFTSETLRDGSPIPKKGEWLLHKGPVIPCQSGLHASLHPFDALKYAPGNFLHLVEVGGEIKKHNDDKIVSSKRKILKTIDAEKLMRDFARWNALQVLHLWPNPPEVVVQYIKTGDESIRAAAWDAARDAAWAAARDVARDAARAAAWAASRAAVWDAARDAALAAALAAAWAAARDVARDAFIKKSRRKFASMVNAAFENA